MSRSFCSRPALLSRQHMLDPAVRIAFLSNGCCDCSPGGDARRATGPCARRKRVIDAGAFHTARGSASGGIGRSTRLLALRRLRPAAPSVRGTAQRGWALPLRAECRILSALPYQGKRFPRSAGMPNSSPSASTGLTRSTRSAPRAKERGFGESRCARAAMAYAGFVVELRTGIAASLLRLSTAARHGCHGSSHASRRACRYLRPSALCVMRSAGKLSRSAPCSLCSG
jgi:hypothetical protein